LYQLRADPLEYAVCQVNFATRLELVFAAQPDKEDIALSADETFA
jgi:hypothetical protein